jgi:SAM-dependent methyltransferase
MNDDILIKSKITDNACPLCKATNANNICQDRWRDYFRCATCNLVFVPPVHFLSSEEEKSRYDLHRNSPDDKDYRQFLSRLFIPLRERLLPGSYGLDFGSGPGPTLSVMFEEIGYSMEIYDYFYAREPSLFTKQYDFITATEVVEHLHDPKKELDRLWTCLKPGGNLGVMTKLLLDCEDFAHWRYKDDPTHVCFFSRSTFEWLATYWQAELTFANQDVILFNKNS